MGGRDRVGHRGVRDADVDLAQVGQLVPGDVDLEVATRIAVQRHHLEAGLGERRGDGGADPARRARHERPARRRHSGVECSPARPASFFS